MNLMNVNYVIILKMYSRREALTISRAIKERTSFLNRNYRFKGQQQQEKERKEKYKCDAVIMNQSSQ